MDIPFGSVRKNVKQNRRSILKHIYTSSKRYIFKLNFWSKDAYSNHPQIMCVLKCKNEIVLDEFEFAPFAFIHFSNLHVGFAFQNLHVLLQLICTCNRDFLLNILNIFSSVEIKTLTWHCV